MADTENHPPRRSTRLRSGTTSSITTSTATPSISDSTSTKPTVSPLRISKSSSQRKTPLTTMSEDTSLLEVSPGSSRRNSPSTFQIKDKLSSLETKSPATSPQMTKSESTSSVRSFWQNGPANDENKRLSKNLEGDDLKSLRSSFVKNNIFLANDMRERESSPKLTMSPSQHRLSTQLGEGSLPLSRIPGPVDGSQSPRKEARSPPLENVELTPKGSILHSNRIKGPRSEEVDSGGSGNRRERRKTVSFDEAPEFHQYDRRSSQGSTTETDQSSAVSEESDKHVETESRPLPSIPRPLPQVPANYTSSDSEDERPSSKDSNDSAYSDMESRIRSMMERVVLRDSLDKAKNKEEDDIFSLYTTVNDMDDEPSSQGSSNNVFGSQDTNSTALSSQFNSQDEEEFERQLALQKQSEELQKLVKNRPFSLAELPDLGFNAPEDDTLGLREFCSPSPEPVVNKPKTESTTAPSKPVVAQVVAQLAAAPELHDTTPPITPPIQPSQFESPTLPQPPTETNLPCTPPASPQKALLETEDDEPVEPTLIVPEQEATIRSRGGSKLRVRPSLSRQEAESLVSSYRRRKSEIPPLPAPVLDGIREGSVEPSSDVKVKVEEEEVDMREMGMTKSVSVKSEVGPLLKIDSLGFENDLGSSAFGEMAVEEMERVIEAQKRGYMMRQHSKVVHASSGGEELRAAKVQQRMAGSISVEWGAKGAPQNPMRKPVMGPPAHARKPSKDLSKSSIPAPPQKKVDSSEAITQAPPPLPRKNSSGEYGRLFIKVVKLKDLELPLPKDEPMYFSCTLDNGLHCVTTPFKLLARESKIEQEFELIATEKLEFMLTLQARINLPPAAPKAKGTLGKGAFQRIFGSPKKKTVTPQPPQKDPYYGLGGIIGRDGSFSRSYIALKTYENAAYGRQFTADIACLNEWALEAGAAGMKGREVQRMRRRPYMVGKIECQLLFVPCINPAEELPKSMSAAVREMKNAEWFGQLLWEGYLSQQGGDCQHWRRRYFKLIGSSLIAYHESTRARRATINLAKSTRVVDDRQSLIETPPVRAKGQRRKSAFHSDDAEGYMYLEEGFRIWFGNGEVIDFRADTTHEKREWVNVLQGVVGKVPLKKEWADAVLMRERALKK